MLSRSRSQVFSRKGSMERSSESSEGLGGGWTLGSRSISASELGNSTGSELGGAGTWWRKEVRRCELWMMTGYSTRTSLKDSFDFCKL